MRTLLSALILLLLSALALGQVQTFRKEVKQVMGSAMSQDDARAAAITKAKRDALEEAGTWLEAQSEVRNFNLAKDDVTALASGLVRTRVLEEQPFAESGVLGVRVVVEVRVDNSGLAERVRQFLADRRQQGLVNAKAEARPGTELPDVKDLVPVADCLESGDGDSRQYTARKWYELGQGLWDAKRGKYSDILTAAKFLSRAVQVDPKYQKAYLARGKLCFQEGEYEWALQALDQASRLDPNDSEVFSIRGRAYDRIKKFDMAVIDHNRAIELTPNRAEYYDSRGLTYMHLKQFDHAMADFNKGVQVEPRNPQSYRWRAAGFSFTNRLDLALADMNRALQLDPVNSGLFHARSDVYTHFGQNEEALADINQALQYAHHGDKPGLLFGRATKYMALGKFDKAKDDFLTACVQGSKAACDMLNTLKR